MRGSVSPMRATRRPRSPISTRRSASIPIMRRPTPIAACCTARAASSNWRSPTTTRRCQHRRQLRRGLCRPRHRLSAAGHSAQALADLNKAIALRPDNAQAYYNRGLLYQSQRQHQVAVDDFTTALGLTTQKADLFVARALSYLALERSQIGGERSRRGGADAAAKPAGLGEPRACLRASGDKEKAAGSYAKALNINDKYEPAKAGFARVGGKTGQSYPDVLRCAAERARRS